MNHDTFKTAQSLIEEITKLRVSISSQKEDIENFEESEYKTSIKASHEFSYIQRKPTYNKRNHKICFSISHEEVLKIMKRKLHSDEQKLWTLKRKFELL